MGSSPPPSPPLVTLSVDEEARSVTGRVALPLEPGTRADAQREALSAALATPLDECARQIGAVVAAAPHRYTKALPGKDEAGRVVFAVAARVEGDRLVPVR